MLPLIRNCHGRFQQLSHIHRNLQSSSVSKPQGARTYISTSRLCADPQFLVPQGTLKAYNSTTIRRLHAEAQNLNRQWERTLMSTSRLCADPQFLVPQAALKNLNAYNSVTIRRLHAEAQTLNRQWGRTLISTSRLCADTQFLVPQGALKNLNAYNFVTIRRLHAEAKKLNRQWGRTLISTSRLCADPQFLVPQGVLNAYNSVTIRRLHAEAQKLNRQLGRTLFSTSRLCADPQFLVPQGALKNLNAYNFVTIRWLHAERQDHRSLVSVEGKEAATFLQGLITNDMGHLEEGATSMYAMLLNRQGRLIFDIIIYRKNEDKYILECDGGKMAELIRHLKIYKLRRKVRVAAEDSLCVWCVFDDPIELTDPGLISATQVDPEELYLNPRSDAEVAIDLQGSAGDILVTRDPRMKYLGHRLLVPAERESLADIVGGLEDNRKNIVNESQNTVKNKDLGENIAQNLHESSVNEQKYSVKNNGGQNLGEQSVNENKNVKNNADLTVNRAENLHENQKNTVKNNLSVNESIKNIRFEIPQGELFRSLRYRLGVGEGPSELPPTKALPLEANCDYLHGVSFHKGCYIGQELTARTFHTGVVRKRYMPIVFLDSTVDTLDSSSPDSTNSPPSSPIALEIPIDTPVLNEKGKVVGKMKGCIGMLGIGLLRVEECLKAQYLTVNDFKIHTFRPYWWPIEASKKLK